MVDVHQHSAENTASIFSTYCDLRCNIQQLLGVTVDRGTTVVKVAGSIPSGVIGIFH